MEKLKIPRRKVYASRTCVVGLLVNSCTDTEKLIEFITRIETASIDINFWLYRRACFKISLKSQAVKIETCILHVQFWKIQKFCVAHLHLSNEEIIKCPYNQKKIPIPIIVISDKTSCSRYLKLNFLTFMITFPRSSTWITEY